MYKWRFKSEGRCIILISLHHNSLCNTGCTKKNVTHQLSYNFLIHEVILSIFQHQVEGSMARVSTKFCLAIYCSCRVRLFLRTYPFFAYGNKTVLNENPSLLIFQFVVFFAVNFLLSDMKSGFTLLQYLNTVWLCKFTSLTVFWQLSMCIQLRFLSQNAK